MVAHTEELIAGRYTLKETLGRGGMGVVWLSHDRLLQRDVAIKEVRFPPSLPDDKRASVRDRVLREARTAAGLNHSGAVSVFDVIHDEERAFIVMELVTSPTLADLIDRDGPLGPERAAEIGLELLDALEAAHERGIVHRDVKPANVMVAPGGMVKLADFGIASVKGDPRLTATGLVLGSPQYMSPEQAQGHDASPASDIWALGATLYCAVEGRPPFDRKMPIPTLAAVLSEDPEPITRAGSMTDVVLACLAKQPEQRPDHARLRGMLRQVAGDIKISPPVALPIEVTREEPERAATPPIAVERPPPARGTSRMLIAAAVVLLLAAAALWAFLSNRDEIPARAQHTEQEDGAQAEGGNEAGAAVVPDGWVTYTDDATGYEIAHPEGWSIEPGRGTPQSVDFVDPESGSYLRVDWTDEPGNSPEGAWYAQEEGFSSTHEDYERIRIEPTTLQGFDAAEWEYAYSEGGDRLRAINLGFVTETHGFALNFQTPEDSWGDLAGEFEAFKASFRAP